MIDEEAIYGGPSARKYEPGDVPTLLAGMSEATRATAETRKAEQGDAFDAVRGMLTLPNEEAKTQLRNHLRYLEANRELLLINLSTNDHEIAVTRDAMQEGGIAV